MDLSQLPVNTIPSIGAVAAMIWCLVYVFRQLLPELGRQQAATIKLIEEAHTANMDGLAISMNAQTKQMEALTDQTKALTDEFRLFLVAQRQPALATSSGFDRNSLGSMIRDQLKTDEGDEAAANLIVALSKKLGLDG